MIVTGYTATRAHRLTPGQKTANRVLATGRAPVEYGFAHLNWRTLTKLRTDPARATHLLRALLGRVGSDEPRSQPLTDGSVRENGGHQVPARLILRVVSARSVVTGEFDRGNEQDHGQQGEGY